MDNENQRKPNLADVQSECPALPIPLDRVGIRNLPIPLSLEACPDMTPASVGRLDLTVELASTCRGVHMSRLVQCAQNLGPILNWDSLNRLLRDACASLQSPASACVLGFPLLLSRSVAPSLAGFASRQVSIAGQLKNDRCAFQIGIAAPVMTVCPCSLAISHKAAHSQRAIISLHVQIAPQKPLINVLADLIGLAENCGSAMAYPLLKRQHEKAITEAAFGRPRFVEDAAREAAGALATWSAVEAYEVEVESLESIHEHNAVAVIRTPNWRQLP